MHSPLGIGSDRSPDLRSFAPAIALLARRTRRCAGTAAGSMQSEPSGSSNRIAGRDERLDEWSRRRARRARDLDTGTVPLPDGRDSGGDGVETSVDVNFRARPRAGDGAKPVTESTMSERDRGLWSLELDLGVADDQRLDPAGRIVIERQMTGGEKRKGQAGGECRQRDPGSHTKGDRSDHLKPLYGCMPEASSRPPAGTTL